MNLNSNLLAEIKRVTKLKNSWSKNNTPLATFQIFLLDFDIKESLAAVKNEDLKHIVRMLSALKNWQ